MPSPSSPGSGLAIGLDLGTSGMKAVALDESGDVVARASAGYRTLRPEVGASEQEPADWIVAARSCAEQIRHQTAGAWAVIGLSGMIPTLVTTDAAGRAIGTAITWEDARAEHDGDAFRLGVGAEALYSATGQWVDGRYLLPMLARLSRVEPARVKATSMIMGAKDYLFDWLTGTAVTDPSTASGYGCYDLHTDWWLDTVRDIARTQSGVDFYLPPVLPSTHLAPLQQSAADELGVPSGIPVCLGAADSVMGAIGMGVTAPGDIAYVGGTSTIILGVTDHLVRDEQHRFLITPMVAPGSWGLEMDLLTTGAGFRWLAGVLGMADESELLALAATSQSSDRPVFLPYLAPGEQGALWDPSLTGTVSGLHLATDRSDVARALVDGIVVESRRCLATLEDFGFDDGPVRVSGGSASDRWFCQQLADASQRTVITSGGSETDRSAAGAAAVGGQAIGWTVTSLVPDREASAPESSAARTWAKQAERHDSVLSAIRGLS